MGSGSDRLRPALRLPAVRRRQQQDHLRASCQARAQPTHHPFKLLLYVVIVIIPFSLQISTLQIFHIAWRVSIGKDSRCAFLNGPRACPPRPGTCWNTSWRSTRTRVSRQARRCSIRGFRARPCSLTTTWSRLVY